MPASVINATVNGLNATGGNTAGLELQVSGTPAVTIDSSGNWLLTNPLPISSGGTGSATGAFSGANVTSINASNISSGTLAVGQGGTGATTLTANNVILGNGTSSVLFVAPGTSGNVLSSNGTTWASTALAASGLSLVVNYSFTGQTYSQFDVTNIPTTNAWYVMVGRLFMNADTQVMSLRYRCSTDNGSSFYSGSSNYWRNGAGSTGPNLIPDTSRTDARIGEITFSYFFYQPSAFNAGDFFSMQGAANAVYIPAAGGVGAAGLYTFTGLLASTSPVNALRFDRSAGTSFFTDGFVKIYQLAAS